MSSFSEANQAKLSLKMKLSHYSWFNGIVVKQDKYGYVITVMVEKRDNSVRKVVPIVHNNVSVNAELEPRNR